MKLSDKMIKLAEDKLEDEETVSRIREKILAPSLSILREEMNKSGTNEKLSSMVNTLLWPVIVMILATFLLTLLVLGLQLYICVTR